jgi:hypothetical protein
MIIYVYYLYVRSIVILSDFGLHKALLHINSFS